MNDYYRPAEYQINTVYRCASCGSEIEIQSGYCASKCTCGGNYEEVGETYPSNSDDWDEERDERGEWRQRR